MAKIGYARVSSAGQSLDTQLEQLTAAGCEKVFAEKQSGLTVTGREQLAFALDYVRDGDVFMVTRLDRLARSIVDLRQIVDRLAAKGVGFRVLQQGEIDTTTPTGKVLLSILGAFAEFENDLRKDRQAEGIAKAKADGRYKGRPPKVDAAQVQQLAAEGLRPTEIAGRLGVTPRTVQRALQGTVPVPQEPRGSKVDRITEQIVQLKREGEGATGISQRLGISRTSVYRALAAAKD